MRSTEVSSAFSINLKHLPISRLLILLTAQISLNVRGTPSWRQAMYKQAEAIASLERPKKKIESHYDIHYGTYYIKKNIYSGSSGHFIIILFYY